MKDYKILINKNAVPVLIEASDNSDPDTWFSLDDESRHIQFKDKESEVSARDLCYESQCPTPTNCTNISCDCKLRIGQTFPLPTGYKVSFEESCTHDSCPVDGKCEHCKEPIKLAILYKLEELSGITTNENDSVVSINSFTTCPHSGLPCYDELCGKTTIICNNAHNFSLESKLNEVAELKRNLGLPVVAPSEEVKHFLLGKKIRYRYVDWEEGSFTPWSPCTERELKTILEDHSIEIVQFKP